MIVRKEGSFLWEKGQIKGEGGLLATAQFFAISAKSVRKWPLIQGATTKYYILLFDCLRSVFFVFYRYSFLCFSQPFLSFEKHLKPLKLFLYNKLLNKIKQLKRFKKFSKGQKRFCKA